MGDIVERLKSQNELYVQKYVGTYDIDENKIEPLCEEAAAEITRLREENARLREALKPFADAYPKNLARSGEWTYDLAGVLLIHLEDAHAALQEGTENG